MIVINIHFLDLLLVSTIASVVTYHFMKQKYEDLRQAKEAAKYFMAEESDIQMLLHEIIQQQSELLKAVKLQGKARAEAEDVLRPKRSETVATVTDTNASEDYESYSVASQKGYVIVDIPKKMESVFASDVDLDSDDSFWNSRTKKTSLSSPVAQDNMKGNMLSLHVNKPLKGQLAIQWFLGL